MFVNVTTAAAVTSADVSIVKTDGADPVTGGTVLTYTLVVTNNGPDDATGVAVTDAVPTGTTFTSADGGGTELAGTVTWNIGALANGATSTLHLTVTVDPLTTTNLSNTATVSATSPDPNPGNDSSTQATQVDLPAAAADLSILKTDSADPATAGTDLTYSLTVTNNGPVAATGVTVTDPVPNGTSFVSADNGGTLAGGTVTWNVGALANGNNTTVHVTVHIDPNRTTGLSNTASVAGDQADGVSSNDSATEPTAIATSADLDITKDALLASPLGTDLLYTLTVTNDGPSDATAVSVTDALPAGVAFVSATPSVGTCSEASGTVTCDLATLANTATATIAIIVTPSAEGDLVNTASVLSAVPDPVNANNSSTVTTTIGPAPTSADLSITKTASPDPIYTGGDVTYTITVTNHGPDSADGVVVTDPLDPRLTFVSADNGGTEAAGVVTWDLGQVANAETQVLTVVATVDSSQASLANTATVLSTTPDPDLTNDQSTVSIDPIDASKVHTDLSLKMTVDPTHPSVGDTATYKIVVHNRGPGDATGVKVSDHLPSGLAFVSSKADVGSYDDATGIWQLGALAAGHDATLYIKTTIAGGTAGTSIKNSAHLVGLNEHDTYGPNNTTQQAITVAGVAGSGGTAFTGAHIATGAVAMLVLLVVGALLLFAGRRREQENGV